MNKKSEYFLTYMPDKHLHYSIEKIDNHTFKATTYFLSSKPDNIEFDIRNNKFKGFEGYSPEEILEEDQEDLKSEFREILDLLLKNDFKIDRRRDDKINKDRVVSELRDISELLG